jgi:hypothetical protein
MVLIWAGGMFGEAVWLPSGDSREVLPASVERSGRGICGRFVTSASIGSPVLREQTCEQVEQTNEQQQRPDGHKKYHEQKEQKNEKFPGGASSKWPYLEGWEYLVVSSRRKIGFPRACLNQRARQSVGMWVIPKWVSFGEAIETHRGVRACHKETPRLLPARLHSTDGRSRPFYPTGMKVMEDEMDPLQLAGGRLPWGVGSSDKVEE